jgi:hypothetical protein
MLCVALTWTLYRFFGHRLIEAMYKGESIAFLNSIIEGQNARPLAEYLQIADIMMGLSSLVVIALGSVLTPLIKAAKTDLRGFIRATLVVVGSSILSLFVAEGLARYAFRDVTSTGDNGSYFAIKGRAGNPPAMNHWGFREREFADKPAEGVYRIAVIGDSFTYGQGITESDRVTNILEQRLSQSTRKFEVLNFGRPGAETLDELEFLHDVVFKVSPDFVLLQWYVNDVEKPDHSKRPPGLRLIPSDALSQLLHEHSALFYLLENQWGTLQTRLGVESYDDYMRRVFMDRDGPDSQAAYGMLTAFIEDTRARGIPMGIVAYPELSYSDGSDETYALGFLIDRVLETCSKSHITCIDLRPTLGAVHPAERLWVNRLDHHPNRMANELAAQPILKQFGHAWMGN